MTYNVTPFMQAIYHAIENHRPEDDLELLQEMFSCFAATAALSEEVRARPDIAIEVVQSALTAAILGYEAVMTVQMDKEVIPLWASSTVGDT